MSYKINKTDGVLLIDLIDGRIDTDTTDLTLIGRNFSGYGELFNENFIKILENFAAVSPPSKPLEGQLWYDKGDGRLKIWNGEQFRSTDTTVVSSIEPLLLAGDIWIDSRRQQLYFNDGTGTTLAGPIFTRDQGPTGFKVETVNDRFGNPKTVAKIIVNSSEVALISREPFEAAISQPGFGKNIQEGITVSTNRPNFEFRGTATRSRQLINSSGDVFVPDNFLKVNDNNITTGTLTVNNDGGLRVGSNVSFLTRIELTPNNTVINEVTTPLANYKLVVTNGNFSNPEPTDAIFVDTANQKIGLWNSNPQATLDVEGDVRIAGNLIIEGDTTTVQTATLQVEDKNIELNFSSNSTLPGDIVADGGGITLLSSNGNKTINWVISGGLGKWTSSEDWNLVAGKGFFINSVPVLSTNTLGATVVNSSLTSVGTLNGLDVDNIGLTGTTIETTNTGLNIISDGAIIVNNQQISGISNPTNPQDAATKAYVDNVAKDEAVRLALDVTGQTDAEIGDILLALYPAGSRNVNIRAYISTSSYSSSVITNPTAQTTKNFVAVDSGGVQNQSVVQDFTFSNATNSVTLSVTRGFKTYNWTGAIWQFLGNSINP